MEQSLADRGNGEELIDTKGGGPYDCQPSMVLQIMPLVYDLGISLLSMQ